MFWSGAKFPSVLGRFCRRFGRASAAADQSGYIAIDALVALMIMASTLVCALTAVHQSAKTAEAAFELRRADDLTSYLIETSPRQAGLTTGKMDGFAWRRVVSDPVLTFGSGSVCIQSVSLVGEKSRRAYTVQTSAVCATGQAS